MVSRLQGRISQIEQLAAPNLKRRRERLAQLENIRRLFRPELDRIMEEAEYCELPNLADLRAEIESDWVEQVLLEMTEFQEMFGETEETSERKQQAIIQADIKFYREIYGREYSADEIRQCGELGKRVREDMKAGLPMRESEAAQEIIKAESGRAARLKKHTDDFAAFIAGLDSRIPDWKFKDSP